METNLTNSITNAEFARLNASKPASVVWRLSRYGHYFGLKPRKLPNRRLVWDRDEVMDFLRKSAI